MANRRLAPASVQPSSFAFTAENENWIQGQIRKYPEGRQASAVIPLLWQAQKQHGNWLPQKAIEAVADRLGMPYIRALEVATFYTMFNLEPAGTYFVQLCGTVPCHVKGAVELREVLRRRIGGDRHVSADGLFSWLEVECLGACCNAPMVQINDDYYEDLTPESLDKLLDDLAAGREVKVGSQIGRVSSEPKDAVNTLTDPALYDGSLVGAWRKRFEEEEAAKAQARRIAEDKARAEAASTDQRAAEEPKAAKPASGRAEESPAADAPAQRSAAGEPPVDPAKRQDAADPASTSTAPAVQPETGAPQPATTRAPDGEGAPPSASDSPDAEQPKKPS